MTLRFVQWLNRWAVIAWRTRDSHDRRRIPSFIDPSDI